MFDEPIHITVAGDPTDPRELPEPPPGVVIHRTCALHPDDVATVHGVPCTSLPRTLIDMAEVVADEEELREMFHRAVAMGSFDRDAFVASRGRVEWRPSLAMLDRVAEPFLT